MVEGKWRDTLYIWDGIVTIGKSNEKHSPVPLRWEGCWVPVTDVPDATKAEAPKRNAFKKDIDADCKFSVVGEATTLVLENINSSSSKGETEKTTGKEKTTEEKKGGDDSFFVAKLTEGDGWEMKDDDSAAGSKKTTYNDKTHDVLVKTLRWSGNQKDQREYLVVANGTNEFGPFVSVGWMRPGCRWTLARRYLVDSDPRVIWPIKKLYQAAVEESVDIEEGSGEKKLRLPPWQMTVMHVDYQDPAKREDAEEKGGGKRQKTSA